MSLTIYAPPSKNKKLTVKKTTTIRTDSDHDDAASDIDREGVNADQARLHFEGAAVDARKANFSDSIAEKRSAYRSKSHSHRHRQRRRREDGTEEVGDLSDSEEEGVERRLARLRREVEDLRIEMENRPVAAAEKGEGGAPAVAAGGRSGEEKEKLGDGVAELSRALDHLYASSRGDLASSHSAAALLSQKLASDTRPAVSASASDSQSQSQQQPKPPTKPVDAATSSPAAAPPSAGIISHAAAFDTRLALIEFSMGISSSSNPFIADGVSSPALQPVLPALEHLSSRLSALTGLLVGTNAASTTALSAAPPGSGASAVPGLTTPHLEALSTRVRKLTTDAEALASARRRAIDVAKAAQAARITSSTSEDGPDPSSASGPVDDEHAAKIHALYATLPTIQSLHPLLPSVLERLRSLRACHAGAAQAAGELDALEKRHAEMDEEIRQWREGLVAVEEKMGQGEVALKQNVEMVEPWVRDLEKRLAMLGGM